MNPPLNIYNELKTKEDVLEMLKEEVENLYLEFKEKKNCNDSKVDHNLQENLSKGISGFANADGGVLIIGITDDKKWKPIGKVKDFEQNINIYLSRATSFPVENINVKTILEPTDNKTGIILIYIPKSDSAPHCSMKDKKYYQRIGDSFRSMEHYQVADIFGRRSHPKLRPYLYLKENIDSKRKVQGTLTIKNEGRATAHFPYLTIKKNESFNFETSRQLNDNLISCYDPFEYREYRGQVNNVIHPNTKLDIAQLEDSFRGNFSDLNINGQIAADSFSLKEWRIFVSKDTILNILENNPQEVKGEFI